MVYNWVKDEAQVTDFCFSRLPANIAAIEKLSPLLQVKYGDLRGSKGNLQEKNVDTQLATDMVTMAAL